MAQITVGLLIPVFNHSKYLDQCIESAIEQTSPFDQIVIVNDASTEPDVQKILDRWADQCGLIEVYHRDENHGICESQNYGVERLNTDFVAFLDCDDYLAKNANEIVSLAIGQTRKDYYFSNRIHVDENDEEVGRYSASHVIDTYGDFTDCLLEHMVASHFKVIKKSSIERIGGFTSGTEGVQDWVVAVQILKNDNWQLIDESIYFHRLHSGQTTGKSQPKHIRVVNQFRRKCLDTKGFKRITVDEGKAKFIGEMLNRGIKHNPIKQLVLLFGSYGVQAYCPAKTYNKETTWRETSFAIILGKAWVEIGQLYSGLKEQNIPIGLLVTHEFDVTVNMARWFSGYLDFVLLASPIAEAEIAGYLAPEIQVIKLGKSSDSNSDDHWSLRFFNCDEHQ